MSLSLGGKVAEKWFGEKREVSVSVFKRNLINSRKNGVVFTKKDWFPVVKALRELGVVDFVGGRNARLVLREEKRIKRL